MRKFFKFIFELIFWAVFLFGCLVLVLMAIPQNLDGVNENQEKNVQIHSYSIRRNQFPYKIKYDKLVDIAERDTCADQTVFDEEYNYTNLSNWLKLIKKTEIGKPYPRPEIYDCENFSISLIDGLAKQGINGIGFVEGIVGDADYPNHGWVSFIAKKRKGEDPAIYYYDPTFGEFLGKASEVKDYKAVSILWF